MNLNSRVSLEVLYSLQLVVDASCAGLGPEDAFLPDVDLVRQLVDVCEHIQIFLLRLLINARVHIFLVAQLVKSVRRRLPRLINVRPGDVDIL